MHHKIVLLLFVAAIATVLGGGHHDYDDGHAHYKFEYGVKDPHTHDVKYQQEYRNGKHLVGGYGLKEPDGTHRVVKYKSSPHTGFEAVVSRHGIAKHPAVYGKYKKHGVGGTSWVGITKWENQGPEEVAYHGGYGGHGNGHEGHHGVGYGGHPVGLGGHLGGHHGYGGHEEKHQGYGYY
ncbi:hypothetical protein NQ317_015178 [Molorchus minor]|uniref:Uncharacterized protein n=1 Tax=Molorchus minor TaxID=1323400 RepID=A0ABQ9K5F2_9CUCU|nr:hypothetical protein NQ317_015178 [Molorchus minor]